jgi:predicted ATP-grasp superfamily ATP-dependent carboligase
MVGLARTLGVAVPETYRPETPDDLRALADQLHYPCIVKLNRGSGGVGLQFPRNKQELLNLYTWAGLFDGKFEFARPLIQEYLSGQVAQVGVLCHHGELRAAVTQRRLRTYPARAGVGVECVTTDEPQLRERSEVLLRALRWHGPAMVEFIAGEPGTEPRLLEINGRLWGMLDLTVSAGADIPLMMCRMALDGDVAPLRSYRVGVRYQWPLPLGILSVISGAPLRTLLDFRPRRDVITDLRWNDPVPHVAELGYLLRRNWKRGFRARPLSPERV